MNVFLAQRYKEPDMTFARGLKQVLEKNGHRVFFTDGSFPQNANFGEIIDEKLYEADVIIILLSENGDYPLSDELFSAHLYHKSFDPLVITVVLGENISIPAIPIGSRHMNIFALNEKIERTFCRISQLIKYDAEAKAESLKKQEEKEKKVQTGLSNYLEDTLSRLKYNESWTMKLAFCLYLLSIVPLAAAILIAIQTTMANAENTIALAIRAIVAFFVVLLFVSMSKLLFTLAKSFMVEAIRSSDRIHAISFGKFFLDAYGNDATREEVLKAFNTWNIDDGKTTFRNQSGDDYDPKLENFIFSIKDIYKSK